MSFSDVSANVLKERAHPSHIRSRDKAQLSCTACRKRKVRCDRLQPCSNCSSRGLSTLCAYNSSQRNLPGRPPKSVHVQERIDELENLVLSLIQQTDTSPGESPTKNPPTLLGKIPSHVATPGRDVRESRSPRRADSQRGGVSPSPSGFGSIRIRESSTSYVTSTHWAAILDSIAELRDQFDQEDEVQLSTRDFAHKKESFPSPQLIYGCPSYASATSILNSIPPRPVVDRLVSRYFHDLDIASGVLHNGKFLQEYEQFWQDPNATPIMWVGLLFGIMCLSTQFQQFVLASANTPPVGDRPACNHQIDLFREKAIHCLLLGHYTKGGPHVLEALILYFLVEVFPIKDTHIGIWILVGNIVQIAMHMGFHRDAKNFPNISPFAGEMRRRIWAMIVQLDFSVSTQIGLPRLIKESQTDTAEPRNLADADFNEGMVELPASRPDTEVTPMLYILAKLRVLSIGVKVADVASEPQAHSYERISELDRQIDETRNALPSSMKWEGLSSCLAVPPQVIMQRIWLEVVVQRLKIVLQRKVLTPSHPLKASIHSRSACLTAAIKILELQNLLDEETQPDGLLYQIRWRLSPSFTHDFLLATSILCFYLQSISRDEAQKGCEIGGWDADKINYLLRGSLAIWRKSSAVSSEARKAVSALQYVLGGIVIGLSSLGTGASVPDVESAPADQLFLGYSDLMSAYDFPGSEQELLAAGSSWQRFGPPSSSELENWNGWNDLQQ